jgi:ABC-type branched-subunit amino acid transport system substrate-binding protein
VSQLLGHINKYDPTTLKCQPDASSTVTVGPSAFLAAAARVAAGSGAVLQGASGTICFTPHGDRVGGTYEKWTIDTVNKLFVSTPAL